MKSLRTIDEFHRDVLHLFQNALMYNNDYHEIYEMAVEMIAELERLVADFRSAQAAIATEVRPFFVCIASNVSSRLRSPRRSSGRARPVATRPLPSRARQSVFLPRASGAGEPPIRHRKDHFVVSLMYYNQFEERDPPPHALPYELYMSSH